MNRQITSITDEQREALGEYAEQWIQRGWATGPLTPAEWDRVDAGIRACYGHAGLRAPRVIVHVPSPLVGALAAPVAALLLQQSRDAVRGAVDRAVDRAVRDAVGDAVRDAVDRAVGGVIRDGWWRRLGGQHWSAWCAYLNAFFDVLDLDLDLPDMAARAHDYAAMADAGWCWMWPDFAMVADRPTDLHIEQVAPTGWGSHRLHNAAGPAIAWADGWAVHSWHGTRVPADLIEGDGWDTTRILREPNAEVRRCAIERVGWDRFVAGAGLAQVGETVPDPGNPGQHLALYDVPEQIYGEPVRVLLATNGTVERDGSRRKFGLTVPARISDPVGAAAWGYDLTPEQYATAQRRA